MHEVKCLKLPSLGFPIILRIPLSFRVYVWAESFLRPATRPSHQAGHFLWAFWESVAVVWHFFGKGDADFGVQLQGCNSGHGLVPCPNSLHSEQSFADRCSSCVTSFRVPMRTKTTSKNKAEYSCLSLLADQDCTFSLFPQVGFYRACGPQRLNKKLEYEVILLTIDPSRRILIITVHRNSICAARSFWPR